MERPSGIKLIPAYYDISKLFKVNLNLAEVFAPLQPSSAPSVE
jgi:hypothetical protein